MSQQTIQDIPVSDDILIAIREFFESPRMSRDFSRLGSRLGAEGIGVDHSGDMKILMKEGPNLLVHVGAPDSPPQSFKTYSTRIEGTKWDVRNGYGGAQYISSFERDKPFKVLVMPIGQPSVGDPRAVRT